MFQTKNTPFYLSAVLIFLGLKYAYSLSGNEDILWLLRPTAGMIASIANAKMEFSIENGYFFEKLNIVIDKSCSGFNFWMLCFMLLVYLGFNVRWGIKGRLLIIPMSFLLAYLVTIFVNTSRILLALLTKNFGIIAQSKSWLHQAEGAFVYLFFLVVIYGGLQYLSSYWIHAKKSYPEKRIR